MKKIVFVIDSLDIGGAETYLVEMLKCAPENLKLKVVTIHGGGKLEADLPEWVELQSVFPNSFQKKGLFFRGTRFFFKKLIFNSKFIAKKLDISVESDLVISFLENQSCRLVSLLDSKKVCWIHTDLTRQDPRFKHSIGTYNQFSKLIFVSKTALESYIKKYGEHGDFEVLYNCINIDSIQEKSNRKERYSLPKGDYTVSVGRLCNAKGYDFMIEALAKLKKIKPDFRHYIIGDGPDKEKISQDIEMFGLTDNVILTGALKNPFPIVKGAKLLLMTSAWEGFGLVVVEALSLNVPVVATEIPAQVEIFSRFNNYYPVKRDLSEVIKQYLTVCNSETDFVYEDSNVFSEFVPANFWSNVLRLKNEV
ncbi:glycosyltransferase [Photobacterium satsumensis]|uniref:glycosyltransferase n=1 Tax=Photobacterium satsumensis TaxID=2910239 RepID=UPI003D1350B0